MSATFAVEFSPLTHRIRAGRTNKHGTTFTHHTDTTTQAALAVAQWVQHQGGIIHLTSQDGPGYRITVEELTTAMYRSAES